MRVLTDRDRGDEVPTVRDLDVVSWRFDRLTDVGYSIDVAIVLAERAEVDLHQACILLERGVSLDEGAQDPDVRQNDRS